MTRQHADPTQGGPSICWTARGQRHRFLRVTLRNRATFVRRSEFRSGVMGQDFSVADRTGQELPIPFDVLNVAYPTHGGGWPMTPSEQFLRFAAECESMAKFTHDRENKPVWHRSAERWIRCAELAESQSVAVSVANAVGRQNRKLGMRASLCHPEVASRTAPLR